MTIARQKQIALTTLIGASLVLGIVSAALHLERYNGFALLGSLAMLCIGFRWLQLDAAELDIRRPLWLNVGIVMAAAIFVPYYLYKTRPQRTRGPAIVCVLRPRARVRVRIRDRRLADELFFRRRNAARRAER